MPTPVRTLCALALAGAWAGPVPAAPPPPPRPQVVDSSGLAKGLGEAIGTLSRARPSFPSPLTLLRLADDLTWTPTETAFLGAGPPAVEGSHWVVTFRVPDVAYGQTWWNTAFGLEVPGTRIRHTVHTDCLVHGWVPAGRPLLCCRGDRPDALVVRLPRFARFTSEFPAGFEPRFETSFGDLKPQFLYGRVAEDQRQDLYRAAKREACARVEEDLAADRQGLAAAVARELQKSFPAGSLGTFADEAGAGLTVANFFDPPPVPESRPAADRPGGWGVFWAAAGLVAAGGVLAWSVLRRKRRGS